MTAIKKAYIGIVEFLQANTEQTVGDVLARVIAMASAKSGGGGGKASTFVRDEESGEVLAIRCYYHSLWMSPAVVEFGKKASSATGLNSMCKDGVSKWTAQERAAKKAKDELLAKVAAGDIDAGDLQAELDAIEKARQAVVPREDGYGFETAEEAIADAQERAAEAE